MRQPDGSSALLTTRLDDSRSIDEVVVVDTGSHDASARVAWERGARVVRHEWRDDFAAARNAGLTAARGHWILILDADERVLPDPAVTPLVIAPRLTRPVPVGRALTNSVGVRRLRVRYERRDDTHEGFLSLGCAMICLSTLEHAVF